MICEGKTAIVAGGAGSGMGRSIALTLAREGALVVGNYLTSSDSAASVVAHIEKQGGRLITIALVPPYDSPAYAYNVAKAAG